MISEKQVIKSTASNCGRKRMWRKTSSLRLCNKYKPKLARRVKESTDQSNSRHVAGKTSCPRYMIPVKAGKDYLERLPRVEGVSKYWDKTRERSNRGSEFFPQGTMEPGSFASHISL